LPKTLDETYERILRGIPEKMQKDAHRIFQWIMVSSRPLGVEELAEEFAINFDEEMSGIPKFEPSWRDTNAETAVLSACSTLVTIVDWKSSRSFEEKKIVQFSHFSVKEYLTSDRIANGEHVSRFHIHPKPAHTLLAKACLSVLLHPGDSIEKVNTKNFPLITYAAEHWVEHARFRDVSPYIGDGIDLLFDKDRPHFTTWVGVYNMDKGGYLPRGDTPEERHPFPLYYAALCGIGGLVERLLTAHPQHPDAAAGYYGAPLNAAFAKGHLDIAQFLLDHGAVGDNMGDHDQTGLYIASSRGYANVVRSLIDRGANLNARCRGWADFGGQVLWTPLHAAIHNNHPDIALLLLEGGADPEARSSKDQTALCMASSRGHANVVRSLIDRGADLNAKSRDWPAYGLEVEWTPLHVAIEKERRDIVLLLLESGADAEMLDSYDENALYMASHRGCVDIVRLLISHGADPNEECGGWTPLHAASEHGIPEIARALLEHGANPNTADPWGRTALHMASIEGDITAVKLLLEHGVNVDVRDKEGCTPLHYAARNPNLQVVVALLDRSADPHAQTNKGETPFQIANAPYEWASKEVRLQVIQLFSERTGERI
jgi:ankyrin repeat protein